MHPPAFVHSCLRIKTTDVAKLQDEYAKLVEGLQEGISEQSDTDGFMGNPGMSIVPPEILLTDLFSST